MAHQLLFNIIIFCLFTVLQSLFINGLHYCFKFNVEKGNDGSYKITGNIFFNVSLWVSKRNGFVWKFLSKPIYECVRCMSSIYGSITFWSFYLIAYEFYWWFFLVWFFNITILVCLNWLIYKKQ